MSLGLPEFGSRGSAEPGQGLWRFFQILGFVVLAHALFTSAIEWRAAYGAGLSIEGARAQVAQAERSAEEMRRSLQKHSGLLIATASVESSPERVLGDLHQVLPEGVSLVSLKIDFLPDATTRLDFGVIARNPQAYDRFLRALLKSPLFTDIKPGSESRPGLVRANVTAKHRKAGVAP